MLVHSLPLAFHTSTTSNTTTFPLLSSQHPAPQHSNRLAFSEHYDTHIEES
ncbi:Protein of unknown function [Pyronema omphalodes CBS 100304]|uniref:Uncharacterized protein n=1 Tax=Pyronema omphalodes (strain CBS 100304) TaxID=1076935 RepID=U4L5D4_PYROM|nr:Protein of unknown function [Pyronema omphalodes CBS 100304]